MNCELYVNKGRGYVESEMHPTDRSMPVDLVRIDAIYNPVRRANFTVAETRVGQRTDYDRLAVSVETNGTITPEDAIAYAAALAQEHFRYFVEFGKVAGVHRAGVADGGGAPASGLAGRLGRAIDDLGLSVRIAQFAQELQHPHPARPGGVHRGRTAQESRTSARRRCRKSPSCCATRSSTSRCSSRTLGGELRITNPGTPPVVPVSHGEDE